MGRPKVQIQQACRDCKKCTNSMMANAGRNSGRVVVGFSTAGFSEIGMRAFSKKCRACGHQLSLHKGGAARTPQPAVQPQVSHAHLPPPPPLLAPGPPAGWYDDPRGQAERRWWSGHIWTEHTTD